MAFCSKCGTQLSDGAKFCPKCGNPTGSTQKESSSTDKDDSPKGIIDAFKEGWKEGVNESGNESNENGGELTTAQKVIHGVLATIAFLSIFGTIGDGMWFAAIVCVAVLIASCYVFIEKQHVWTTAICGFLLLTLAVGATAPDEDKGKQTQTEQKQNEKEGKQSQTEQKQNESATTVPPSSNNEETTNVQQDLSWLKGHWVYRSADYEAHLIITEKMASQYSTLNPEPTYYTYSVDGNQLYVKPMKNDGTDFVATLDLQNHRIDYGNGLWMHKIK